MPMLFSYDLTGAPIPDRDRIRSMFLRFGWDHIGGSSFRFPKLSKDYISPEDWMDRVVPALMCFRAYGRKKRLKVANYSLDAHVSTGGPELLAARHRFQVSRPGK